MEIINAENQYHEKWLIDCLKEWDMTFEEETEIPQLLGKIKNKTDLTYDEVSFLIFHIWQMSHGELLNNKTKVKNAKHQQKLRKHRLQDLMIDSNNNPP